MLKNPKLQDSKSPANMDVFGLLNYPFEMEALEDELKQLLPSELTDKISIASFFNGELVVLCPDATSASHLLYLVDEYTDKIKRHPKFAELQSIKVKVDIK